MMMYISREKAHIYLKLGKNTRKTLYVKFHDNNTYHVFQMKCSLIQCLIQ